LKKINQNHFFRKHIKKINMMKLAVAGVSRRIWGRRPTSSRLRELVFLFFFSPKKSNNSFLWCSRDLKKIYFFQNIFSNFFFQFFFQTCFYQKYFFSKYFFKKTYLYSPIQKSYSYRQECCCEHEKRWYT